VFAGDTSDLGQMERIGNLADNIGGEDGFLKRYGGKDHEAFDVLSISSAGKEKVNYTDFPEVFRSHWSRVLLDDTDMFGRVGGKGYEYFGIDPKCGAIVVVRPDGYVGNIVSFEDVKHLDRYFEGFMVSQRV